MTPKRIQRKRVKGWRMPENTVSITRPGKWGNPFKVAYYGAGWGVDDGDYPDPIEIFSTKDAALASCLELYREYISHEHNAGEVNVFDLKGKNLACFCKEGEPCHGDILLELSNNQTT